MHSTLAAMENKKSSTCCFFTFNFVFHYTDLLPLTNEMINKIRKMKNNTFAIPAAPAAIPPNPKIAAMIATTKKITVQRNI